MKNSIILFSIFTLLITGMTFSGCQDQNQDSNTNLERSQKDVVDAQSDLEKAKIEEREARAKNEEVDEWRIFKLESELKIRENEVRIAELREKSRTSGRSSDNMRTTRIDNLEKRNKELKNQIDAYDRNQNNLEAFKYEFNQKMETIKAEFNELTSSN